MFYCMFYFTCDRSFSAAASAGAIGTQKAKRHRVGVGRRALVDCVIISRVARTRDVIVFVAVLGHDVVGALHRLNLRRHRSTRILAENMTYVIEYCVSNTSTSFLGLLTLKNVVTKY